MSIANHITKKIFFALYLLVLGGLGANLFFSDQVTALFGTFEQPTKHQAAAQLIIGYALEPQNLDPILFDPLTRSRLVDVYEGLVRTDRNLKLKPALAVTWGLLDPLTWEFQLRPNVKFHNGKSLTAEDIVLSIDRARQNKNSQLKNLLGTIESVKVMGPAKIEIKTKQPDPLLLNKLAVTFVVPQDLDNFSMPVGTGPYTFASWDKKEQMVLKLFSGYWGEQAGYDQVVLKTIADKDDRVEALKKGDLHILADVPPPVANDLSKENLLIKSIPSLEVSFLMFNLEDPFLQQPEVRAAIPFAIDRQVLVKLAQGFASPVHQFVSSGIFGFNPQMVTKEFNLLRAQKIIAQFVNDRDNIVTLDYPDGYDLIAQYLQQQLYQLNIDLRLNPLSASDLEKKIKEGSSQMYFLGWRSELGDASDFLVANVHSPDSQGKYGQFNGTHYLNKKVDQLIENSAQNLNTKSRLKDLQEAMKIIVEEDQIGIPLIELQTIFAFQKRIKFEPRVDGFLYASEIL